MTKLGLTVMIKVMFGGMLNGLVEIIYPKTCAACKAGLKNRASIDNIVCAECWGKIKRNLPPFCHSCGRHLEKRNLAKNICPACLKRPRHFDRAFSPCVYEGVIKELIHEFKYKGRDYLGATLSRLTIDFIKEYNLPVDYRDLIVPVPLHQARLRQREFNQSEILGSHIAGEFHKDIISSCLLRSRNTRTQTELETEERLLNVKDSFLVKKTEAIKDKNILLIDDVLTTGSTVSYAASALKDAGSGIVFVLTLAN